MPTEFPTAADEPAGVTSTGVSRRARRERLETVPSRERGRSLRAWATAAGGGGEHADQG